MCGLCRCFFFQAEDGIRDGHVTGVQTCALPISERWRTRGFTYRHHLDVWECTQGQQLWPKEVDHELRVIRYRAKAPVCNACPIKSDCTDADDGRELTVALDPWPHSEAGRFHRGISLVLVVLAATFIVIEAARHH